jgi:Tfp pilus assembly protein PilN
MRVNLNLLPESKKEETEKKKRLKIILRQGFLLFSIIVFLAVILANMYLVLQIQLKSIEDLSSQEQDLTSMVELKKYENKFKDTNSRISLLGQIEKSKVYWSHLFTILSQTAPDNITISNLATRDFSVMLSGKAQSRDDLIKFKDNLSNDNCLTDVNVPLSNLVVKENVDFQIDLKIKKECLQNE